MAEHPREVIGLSHFSFSQCSTTGVMWDRTYNRNFFYLMIHSTHFILWSYSLAHMVKDCSDSKKGNLLLSHGLLFPISSKGSFIICKHPRQDSTYHDIWIEQEIAQLDRSDYPSHYEWMLYHRATSRSVHKRCLAAKQRVTNEVAAVSFLFFIRVVLYHA